ncbi:MAG: hypothetical protein JSR18_04385 [Proteobacteria bacterium]|nr:hypothetical protein [Pseudomonadota bacterium]
MAAIAVVVLGLAGCAGMGMDKGPSFFVTSSNPGKGADFGGLAGADAHCQALATAAGYGGRTWHAYLSTQATAGAAAVNARDRIGTGPWTNVKGVVIANSVAELHGNNNLNKQTALTEKGAVLPGRGDTPNQHDVLTGTQPDGTAFPPGEDKTCRNWTSGNEGSAIVGHLDRTGLDTSPPALSWNSSHGTRGCSIPQLNATGGQGYLYCFAVK